MSCYGSMGEPMPCAGWALYNSYATDPIYVGYMTIAWTTVLALTFVALFPSIYGFVRSGRWKEDGLVAYFGLYEEWQTKGYAQVAETNPKERPIRSTTPKFVLGSVAIFQKISRTTLRLPSILTRLPFLRPQRSEVSCHPSQSFLPFSLGSLFLALLIPIFVFSTLFPGSQLVANPNRFGFFALGLLPPLFILSSKSSPITWLTNQGWTAINFLHRWLGRMVVLLVFLHAYFWAVPWTGDFTAFFSQTKQVQGTTAFAFLLLIAVSSAKSIRRWSYSIFFVLHYVGIIGFLVFVNTHTIYARGWATYAILAIYGADIVGRLSGLRIRYVEVEALEGGMTRIGMSGLTKGWRAGQHLSIRLFFSPPSLKISSAARLFEAHPFSIATAPLSVGVLNSTLDQTNSRGVELFIRSCGEGTWTGDLLATAQLGAQIALGLPTPTNENGRPQKKKLLHMLALVEGPYGGLGPYTSMDQESILLVAGGSGMGFTIGVLDEIVGRRIKSGSGGKISLVWAVRERGHIAWFAESLRTIVEAASKSPNLAVSIRIYITCDPLLTAAVDSSLPSTPTTSAADSLIPKTLLVYSRPALSQIVNETVDAALAPCGRCWPVCYCGDASNGGDGICINDEEECCTGPADARDLIVGDDEEKMLEKKEIDSLDDLPACCGAKVDSIQEIVQKSGCCSSSAEKSTACGGCCAGTGSGCCSGRVEGEKEQPKLCPLRIRTGGLGVVVCGPSSMISELRSAVAEIPIAKSIRIGGVDFHAEGFSV